MTETFTLKIDPSKIRFFGICIALLYGLSPLGAVIFFDEQLPHLASYLLVFGFCCIYFFGITFSRVNQYIFQVNVSGQRIAILLVIAILAFTLVQANFYSDFYSAFIAAYTSRTGIESDTDLKYIFYPATALFTFGTFISVIYIYSSRSSNKRRVLALVVIATLLTAGLGSRNTLLWSYSGLLTLIVSRINKSTIALLVGAMYLFAIIFAYIRNSGYLAYLLGLDDLFGALDWAYFNPLAHEFSGPYRLFEMILDTVDYSSVVAAAPYGMWSSLLLNMLPLILKPEGFISFTNYLSTIFANEGEGVGSSPMAELLLTNGVSLAFITLIGFLVFWPKYFIKNIDLYRMLSILLWIAIYFNFWRIGTPELLKYFLSIVVVGIVTQRFLGLSVTQN